MAEKQVQFFPFHALNEFMNSEYRLSLIRTTLSALPQLPESLRAPIDRLTKQLVTVPGFRNSSKAPAALKARPMSEAFEKHPNLVVAVLSAWAEAHRELRQQVYDLLIARGWEVLPAEADRAQLPGFLTTWPKGEDFEVLNAAFTEMYPDVEAGSDDVSLMVVWLSGRLPYQMEGEEEKEEESKEEKDEEAGE